MAMKLLINTPSLALLGGVANHYAGLRPFWTERVRYNTVGKRLRAKAGGGKYWLPYDVVKFVLRLLLFRPDAVLLNPSLGASALRRDFVFLRIARALGFKVAVFVHGFDWDYAKRIDKEWVARNFNMASLIFVLARQFEDELKSWGVTVPVRLTTTKVDDFMLKGFDLQAERDFTKRRVLFLARIEKEKGVYEAADTYAILKERYPDLTLTYVGDGSELAALKRYVADRRLGGVTFTGRLSGAALAEEYRKANFFFFFTSYGEGMPAVVLEAMAFGLPVFTRRVGGLADFFEDGKMGYITDSLDPRDFAAAMGPYLESAVLTEKVSLYNARYAKAHFMASRVARQIEDTVRESLAL